MGNGKLTLEFAFLHWTVNSFMKISIKLLIPEILWENGIYIQIERKTLQYLEKDYVTMNEQ